ncbi:MAG TPA: GDSL-type esterase/lipase family protein [Actinoplanes sp.]|nr:GDSL-type esterase/lipase family protein [Actinoplanes sp.]
MRLLRLFLASALAIPLLVAGPAVADLPGCGVKPADAAAAAATTTVWLAGDSTMANPSSGTTCPVGWGARFDPLFNADVVVNNLAIGGRSIQTWLYEGNVTSTIGSDGECVLSSTAYSSRWTQVLNGIKAGDYLFIQFGINDGSTTCPRHVGTSRYQSLMTYMANTAKAKGATPIVLTAVAAITCSGSTAVKNRGFVTQTQAAATATGAKLIDLQTLSVNHYNAVKLCPNNGDYNSGLVGQYFCADHTHFEAYGAQQIARLVAGALRTQNIPLAAYLL